MRKIIFILLFALAAIGAWFVFSKPPGVNVSQTQKDIYYCPMHPKYTSDRPGDCPICHMKLVKREVKQTSATEEHTHIVLSPQKQQLIGIKTVMAVRKPLVKTIHAYGYVAHDLELYEAQLEYIDAWRNFYAFQIRRPVADEFRSDWREYYKKDPAQNRWRNDEKVKAQERLIKAEYELIHMGLTETQIAQLREIKYGQPWVQPDLLFFGENQPVWIYAQVFESEIGYIAVGQKAMVTIPAYGETAEGVVKGMAMLVDPATRTARVRIELPQYRSELGVNMFVDVDMPVELNDALLVPREAVMDTGLNKIVFVAKEQGVFEPRKIQTGMEGDGMIAVTSGLNEGERVVSAGNFFLDSESRLESAFDSTMDSPMETGGQHVH